MSRKNTPEDIKVRTVVDERGCWVWQYARQKDGYGTVRYHGKTYLAHRLSYKLFVGEIAPHLEIDHLCRNRACINPEHLEPVTHAENMKRGDCKANGPRIRAFHNNKTHCKQGHPYEGNNIIWDFKSGKSPRRHCRACKNAWRRERRANKRSLGEMKAA